MRKRVLISAVTVGLVGWFLLYCAAHGQAERKSRLVGAGSVLRQAYDEYVKTGTLPSRNGTWTIVAYTNQILVSGRTIQLAAATCLADGDPSLGLFAIAPTGELVWLRADRKPVLVSSSQYRVPLWRDGY